MAAGYRSPFAFWSGSVPPAPTQAGYRGLLAFWSGGAMVPGTPVVTPPAAPATGAPRRLHYGGRVRSPLRKYENDAALEIERPKKKRPAAAIRDGIEIQADDEETLIWLLMAWDD